MATKQNWVTVVMSIVVSLMIAIGAVLKIIKLRKILLDFSKLGVVQYTQILGIFELICLALLLYKKTMKVGFLLLCSYFGGAIATHLSHNEMFLQPAFLLACVTVSVFLRDKTVFYSPPNPTAG